MARGIEGNEIASPKPSQRSSRPPSSAKSSSQGQKSLLGFFQKQTGPALKKATPSLPKQSSSNVSPGPPHELTPAPSSDAPGPEMSSPLLPSGTKVNGDSKPQKRSATGSQYLSSPASSAFTADASAVTSSPTRKVHLAIGRLTVLDRITQADLGPG